MFFEVCRGSFQPKEEDVVVREAAGGKLALLSFSYRVFFLTGPPLNLLSVGR